MYSGPRDARCCCMPRTYLMRAPRSPERLGPLLYDMWTAWSGCLSPRALCWPCGDTNGGDISYTVFYHRRTHGAAMAVSRCSIPALHRSVGLASAFGLCLPARGCGLYTVADASPSRAGARQSVPMIIYEYIPGVRARPAPPSDHSVVMVANLQSHPALRS